MSAGTAAFAPIDAPRRILALDAIRGFALLGIFLMNVEWFTRPMQEMGSGIASGATGLDHAVAWLVYVFVQGKFWVLFSLLFGMGFAVMSARAGDASTFNKAYLRRCAVLLLFGVAHAVLLWPGDILHSYAVAALILLAFGEMADRKRLWLGIAIYAGVVVLSLLIGGMLSVLPAEAGEELAKASGLTREAAAAAAQVYAHGDFIQVTAQRWRDFMRLLESDVVVVPMAIGVFMIGVWLVRSGRMHDVAAQRAFFARLALYAVPSGLALVACSVALGTSFDIGSQMGMMTLASAVMLAGSLPLALGYLALFVLGLGVPGLRRVLGWLAPAGRMALTNYLLQSLVAALVFHGYGMALWGELGRAAQVALVFAVFAAQLLLSALWLSRFRFGPMEWLWRWLTYGARPPMRKA
ncbi:DUF418 domain-containing protein [Luteimonas soli]|uniref:DUF418 domain-containing protein n=1 Tax=Luteimonas soli TaxID=1648966 RepID=A0ABV7XP07_9GAMM